MAMTHPWWPWRPCWQLVGAGETCVPGRCCMAGTAIRRGPSPLGAGGCGGGWRPSPLGCTAALSTVGGCAMLPTACTRWPGGNAETPVSLVSPAVPLPGKPLWVPRVQQRPSRDPGAAWEGLWGSAGPFVGCWWAQESLWASAGSFVGCWGAQEGPWGSSGTFVGSWGGLGESLGVSWDLHRVLGCSGGPLGDPGGKRGPSRGAGGLRQAPQRPP